MPVAVVTDSTAYLPADLVSEHRLTVVPLTVVVDGAAAYSEDTMPSAEVAAALTGRTTRLTTSRPSPEEFAGTYRRLLDQGADAVVSVHLSAGLSGTADAAALGADMVGDRVSVVDSGSIGMGLGFPVLAAATAAARGADPTGVRQAARDAIGRTRIFFYVDSLESLRRGGRINTASALLGTALAVKPILHMVDGHIAVLDRVRTAGRGLARLAELAVQAASPVVDGEAGVADGEAGAAGGEISGPATGGEAGAVRVAVHHFHAEQRAEGLIAVLAARLGDRLREIHLTEAGAVVATHTGPGLVCVVVHRLD